jgi:glycosidase
MDDFDDLLADVKQRGMHLVMDYVPNHSSTEHPWFNASRLREGNYTDYYMWYNGTGPNGTDPPNNWISAFAGIAWEFDTVRGQFYLHEFAVEQADLNYRNPLMHEELAGNWQFWLDKGIDGFRVDAPHMIYEAVGMPDEPRSYAANATPFDYDYLDHIYTQCQPEFGPIILEWREILDVYEEMDNEHRLMVLESWCSQLGMETFYGNGSYPIADFPFNPDLMSLSSESTGYDIYSYIETWLDPLPYYAWPNWVVGNHDNRRIASKVGSDNVDAVYMMIMLLGGTPIVYNGDEIGMVNNMNITYNQSLDPQGCNYGPTEYLQYSRDPERTPMQWNNSLQAGFTGPTATPWLPVNSNYPYLNVMVQQTETKSHLNVFKTLVALRTQDSIMYGSLEFLEVTEQAISFTRVLRGSLGYAVIINFSAQAAQVDLTRQYCCQDFSLPATGQVHVTSTTSPRVPGDIVQFNFIELDPNEALVVEFDPNVRSME